MVSAQFCPVGEWTGWQVLPVKELTILAKSRNRLAEMHLFCVESLRKIVLSEFPHPRTFVLARRRTTNRTRSRIPAKTSEPVVASVNFESEAVRVRLARIESNYVKLDQLLADLEARVPDQEQKKNGTAGPGKPR